MLAVLLLGYGGYLGIQAFRPEPEQPARATAEAGTVQVYFSNPGGAATYTLRGGPDARLAAAIDQATDHIQLAAYDLNLWSIRDALLRAHARGVLVQLVMESSHLDRPEVQQLLDAGVAVRGDERPPLMHHKFVVLDGRQLWTGSMNFTTNGAYRNNNNLLRIDSEAVSRLYAAEFAEMFDRREFGQLSAPQTPSLPIALDDVQIEVWFTPDQPAGARIVELIRAAESEIVLMAFNLTLDSIAEALIEAAERGVEVQALLESSQSDNQGSDAARLALAGVEVVTDGNPGNMHHKVIVLDRSIVVSGSYNFSRSAEEQNDENLLIVSSAELAEQYLLEFSRLKAQGQR